MNFVLSVGITFPLPPYFPQINNYIYKQIKVDFWKLYFSPRTQPHLPSLFLGYQYALTSGAKSDQLLPGDHLHNDAERLLLGSRRTVHQPVIARCWRESRGS